MESVLGKITVIQIADLGKIRFMNMKLDSKNNLVRFVGPNEAGKSTVLDSIQNLFQSSSSIPNGIIRNGIYSEGVRAGEQIDKGMARVETENGYVIERVVRKSKDGSQVAELKVLHNGVPVQGGPLNFLKSVSTKYPDPHKVSNLSEKELFTELSSLIQFNFKKYDDEIAETKEDSKAARVLLKNLGAEVRMPASEKPEVIPGKSLSELIAAAGPKRLALQIRKDNFNRAANVWDNAITEIKELEEKITHLKESLLNLKDKGFNRDNPPTDTELEELDKRITSLSTNSQVVQEWTAYENDSKKRKEYSDRLFKNEQKCLVLEKDKWSAFLRDAKASLPEKTVMLTETGSVIRETDNIPWETLSHSSRLTLAAHLCMATIPEGALRAVYIERGESIGSEKRAIIAQVADKYDVQVFMEVFSEDQVVGDGIFLLEEGEIKMGEEVIPVVNFPRENEQFANDYKDKIPAEQFGTEEEVVEESNSDFDLF